MTKYQLIQRFLFVPAKEKIALIRHADVLTKFLDHGGTVGAIGLLQLLSAEYTREYKP